MAIGEIVWDFEEDFIDGFLPGVEFGDEEVDELANYIYERSFDLGIMLRNNIC